MDDDWGDPHFRTPPSTFIHVLEQRSKMLRDFELGFNFCSRKQTTISQRLRESQVERCRRDNLAKAFAQ